MTATAEVLPVLSPDDFQDELQAAMSGQLIDKTWPFNQAADQWLLDNELMLKSNTIRSYRDNIARLKEFFGATPLEKIHIGHVRAYQKKRRQKAGPVLINGECSRLQSIMKAVKLWKPFEDNYKPLPILKEKTRDNMSEDEEKRLYKACLKPGKRLLAGHCLIVMANTTMGFWELSHLRREDVKLNADIPHVIVDKEAGGAKNDYRDRTIPLNFMALRSMRWLVDRWQKAGGTDPKSFILFHRAQRHHGEVDFYKPQGHIYKAARKILAEAGLSHLKPYDMRGHSITKLLSNPKVSGQVAQEIAGHISKRMQDRYSKQRLENKKTALDAFSSGSILEEAALDAEKKKALLEEIEAE